MPINTTMCPHCGARVNHTVRAGDKDDTSAVINIKCPRCKQEFLLAKDALSERTREGITELNQFEELMNGSDDAFTKAVADDEGDSVETALDRADKVFSAARQALDEISIESTTESIDADELLSTFSVPDVKQFTLGQTQRVVAKAQEKYDLPDTVVEAVSSVVDDAVSNAVDSAYERVSKKVAEKAPKLGKIPEV